MNDITENKIDNDFDDLLESLIEPENKVQLATIGKSRVKATSTNPVEEYKYSGIELYPSVFKEIMLKLYFGKQFTRQEAIEETKKYHISHGGVCNKTNYVSAFKKGISALQSEGYSLDNPAYGCWKLKANNECAEARS